MSLLFRVVFAHECTSTHHKLALDALRHLRRDDATRWMNLFLTHFDAYLQGAKDPDKRFKDFRNHVLHVGENEWGGAVEKVCEWFDQTVAELRARRWRRAAYAAGVLSHYFTDPWMPLHTGQSEAEGSVHRALEWSVTRCYGELQNILEEDLGGYPDLDLPKGDDWLPQLLRNGARQANAHYATLLDHYDLERGARQPEQGLDQPLKDCLAGLIGQTTIAWSRVLEQAIDRSGAEPPNCHITLLGYLASLSTPIAWVVRKLQDRKDRAVVRRIHREVQQHGKAIKSLPPDERQVRQLHAEEVLRIPLEELDAQPAAATGTKFGQGAELRQRANRPVCKIVRPLSRIEGTRAAASSESRSPTRPRFYLEPEHEVVDAPSIGRKTAKRLHAAGVQTVADLLAADAEQLAELLDVGHIDAQTISNWQCQARLMCRTPHLRVHDAQVLVGCDIRQPESLAEWEAEDLLPVVEAFVDSPDGRRLLPQGSRPDLAELRRWRQWAAQARPLPEAA